MIRRLHKIANIHQAVAKGKSWREAGVQPDAAGVPLRFVRQIDLGQQRFDWLRQMQIAGQTVAGNDPQPQWLARIGPQELGIVRVLSIDGFGFQSDLVRAVKGNTFGKSENRSIGPFVFVGTDDVVQRHVLEADWSFREPDRSPVADESYRETSTFAAAAFPAAAMPFQPPCRQPPGSEPAESPEVTSVSPTLSSCSVV